MALLLCASVAVACASAPPRDASRVLGADLERIDAMVDADASRLERCLHEDLTYTHSTGSVDTRASLIASLVEGSVDYRAIVPLRPEARIYGDVAILTSSTRMEVSSGGETFAIDGVYTAVYRWEAERWQLVAYHSSPRTP